MHCFIAFMLKFRFHLHDFYSEWAASARQEIRLCKSLCYTIRCLPFISHFSPKESVSFPCLRITLHSLMTMDKYITPRKEIFENYMCPFLLNQFPTILLTNVLKY